MINLSHNISSQRFSKESGFTLVELLVSSVVSAIVILGASSIYFSSMTSYHNFRIKSEADETAQIVLDMMANDIKFTGNGLPNLSGWTGPSTTAAVPIDSTYSSSSAILMRSSKTGSPAVLSADASPSLSGFNIQLISNIFAAGDRIYLNASPTGYEYGLIGYVSAINGLQTSIAGNSVAAQAPSYSAGASFKAGTLAYKIPFTYYKSNADWSGITTWEGSIVDGTFAGQTKVAPNTTFLLEYFDRNMATVALSDANVTSSLALVRITVYARGASPLTNGTTYQSWAQKTVGIRYLTVGRNQSWNCASAGC